MISDGEKTKKNYGFRIGAIHQKLQYLVGNLQIVAARKDVQRAAAAGKVHFAVRNFATVKVLVIKIT